MKAFASTAAFGVLLGAIGCDSGANEAVEKPAAVKYIAPRLERLLARR